MIDYVRKLPDGSVLWREDGIEHQSGESLSRLLNRWAQENLSTVEGRILAVKRQFSLRSRIPVFLDEDRLLMPMKPIRTAEALLINFHAVRDWKIRPSGQVEVTFRQGSPLLLDGGNTFRRLMAASRTIADFSLSRKGS